MAIYNIYTSFNRSDIPVVTAEFETEDQADEAAWEAACEEYESYAGLHGIPGYDTITKEALVVYGIISSLDDIKNEDIGNMVDSIEDKAAFDEIVDELFSEEVSGWIEYYSILADEDPKWDYKNECERIE